jgi:hypothetical protein
MHVPRRQYPPIACRCQHGLRRHDPLLSCRSMPFVLAYVYHALMFLGMKRNVDRDRHTSSQGVRRQRKSSIGSNRCRLSARRCRHTGVTTGATAAASTGGTTTTTTSTITSTLLMVPMSATMCRGDNTLAPNERSARTPCDGLFSMGGDHVLDGAAISYS